jgi:lysophospholipase L1-like esterase
MDRPNSSRRVAALLLACAVVAGAASGCTGSSPTPWPFIAATATPSGAATASATAAATPTAVVKDTTSPTPDPQLPALLATIGDSYTTAFSVSPSYLYDHRQFSWAVGKAQNDGVFSLYERFGALGPSPIVADAATLGRKMNDAPRQAGIVVAAAKKLKAGEIAYVTFELGTNDVCDDPKTDPLVYQSDLATAIGILRAGLPAGSRILMLPVPDFPHFRAITQADAAARANLAVPPGNRCAPYLGSNSPSTLDEANYFLGQYDSALKEACAEIQAKDAPTGRLFCTYNAELLADSDWVIGDLSTVDYFHPSLKGQARMAAAAWAADVYHVIPIPQGSVQ